MQRVALGSQSPFGCGAVSASLSRLQSLTTVSVSIAFRLWSRFGWALPPHNHLWAGVSIAFRLWSRFGYEVKESEILAIIPIGVSIAFRLWSRFG